MTHRRITWLLTIAAKGLGQGYDRTYLSVAGIYGINVNLLHSGGAKACSTGSDNNTTQTGVDGHSLARTTMYGGGEEKQNKNAKRGKTGRCQAVVVAL